MRLPVKYAVMLCLVCAATARGAEEVPFLADRVAAGELPAVAERLPAAPRVVDVAGSGGEPGRYGGVLRMLMGNSQDIRMVNVYGYARLVGYDRNFELQPDILESIEVERDRVFTLRLREGHKWSDGAPFTSEDFRYFWEDVALNEELSPFGPPKELLPEDEAPTVTFPDALTVRYEWSRPNPYF